MGHHRAHHAGRRPQVAPGLLLAAALLAGGCRRHEPGARDSGPVLERVREGDIVFQKWWSLQGETVELATSSRYSHVGIVIVEGGTPLVLEAGQLVKRMPLAEWIERGVGRHVVVKRLRDADSVLTPEVLKRMRAVGNSFLGRGPDLAFAWDDKRLYSAELVFKVYKRGAGVQIGRLQKLGDFDLSDPLVQSKLREKYGADIPIDTPVVSPQSIFDDEKLVTVVEQ